MASRREQSIDRRILLLLVLLVGAVLLWMVGTSLVATLVASAGPTISPMSLEFEGNSERDLTITNPHRHALRIAAVSVSDPHTFEATKHCDTVSPGKGCSIRVRFTGRPDTERLEQLTVVTTAPRRSQLVRLHVRGPQPTPPSPDAAVPDAAPPDAATPAVVTPDAAAPDAALPDAALHDATPTTAPRDAAPRDAAPPDAPLDAAPPDAATPDTASLDAAPLDVAAPTTAPLDAAPPDAA